MHSIKTLGSRHKNSCSMIVHIQPSRDAITSETPEPSTVRTKEILP